MVAATDTALDLETTSDLETTLKALASERRLQILKWLKDTEAHFPPQVHGHPIDDGACNQFIADKLGVSQPAASRHLKVLVDAGLIIATPRKGWTYYKRDEAALAGLKHVVNDL